MAPPRLVSHARHSGSGRQGGIAIVSVLMALAVILMLGLGSMMLTRSNLMTSENLVSNSIARNNAEAGIDATVAWLFARFQQDGALPSSLANAPIVSLPTGAANFSLADGGYVKHDDELVTLRIAGRGPRNSEYVAEALIAFAAGGPSGVTGPFNSAIVGCDGVEANGSGMIDSFDSRQGLYSAASAGRSGHVSTVSPGATVRLTGNSPIAGDVNSTGGVYADGSSRVLGSINANGLVDIRASAIYEGDIRTTGDILLNNTATIRGGVASNGNITFGNGAKVDGGLLAGGNVAFNNTGARVGGDARVGGSITRGHNNNAVVHVLGTTVTNAGPVNNTPVPSQECDPLSISSAMAAYTSLPSSGVLSTGYPKNKYHFTPSSVTHYDETWNVQAWTTDNARVPHQVEVFGEQATMYKTGNFTIGSGELRISGGHVVLFVNGDFTMGLNGGSGLIIDQNSSLTVFVTGKTRIGSAVQMAGRSPVNADGSQAFAIYSSYSNASRATQWNNAAGVSIEGNSRLTANIYAPLAHVWVNAGGGMYGSARGKWVDVTGGAGLHYDQALATVGAGGSEGGEPSVAVLSRR